MTSTTIWANDKAVGHVKDGLYVTYRRPWHYFRKYGGFGISVEVLNRLSEMGVRKVRVEYHGPSGRRPYTWDLSAILKEPIIAVRGHDEQRVARVPPRQRHVLEGESLDAEKGAWDHG